jgi:predicted metalloprotease
MKKTIITLAATGMLVAALSACSLPVTGSAAPAASAPQSQTQATPPVDTPAQNGGKQAPVSQAAFGQVQFSDQDAAYERVLSDAAALQPLLDEFWSQHLYDVYGLEFDTPDRFEYYIADEGNSTCGGEYAPGVMNAYYCPVDGDEYIAFDVDWLASYLDAHPGDATTFLVLAHEWGHAVQDTWTEQQPGYDYWLGPAQELNADCLAGVFWDEGVRNGFIIEEDGDADAIFQWLYEGGSGTWMDPGDHGSPEQRQVAFADGYAYGADYCRTNY